MLLHEKLLCRLELMESKREGGWLIILFRLCINQKGKSFNSERYVQKKKNSCLDK